MSVINRVLNDIEKRNNTAENNSASSFEPVDIKNPLMLNGFQAC